VADNPTLYVQATQTAQYWQTRTPYAAATGTAFVQQMNSTATQRVALTQNYASTSAVAQLNANNLAATQSAFSTANAVGAATLWAQPTINSQSTGVAVAQATLVQNQTNVAAQQPTNDYYSTRAYATQNYAATQYASSANATTSALLTQSAANVNAANNLATAQANANATTSAQLNSYATQMAQSNAQATTIAQGLPTTVAQQATQQAQPLVNAPGQPDLSYSAGCIPPAPTVNPFTWLGWTIENQVCIFGKFISWSPQNNEQVKLLRRVCTLVEPCGTIIELGSAWDRVTNLWKSNDWADSGFDDGNNGNVNGNSANPGRFATDARGILLGNLDLSLNSPDRIYYSTTCNIRLGNAFGPFVTPPICFLYNVLRELGFLAWIQLLFDFVMLYALVKYFQKVWIRKAMA